MTGLPNTITESSEARLPSSQPRNRSTVASVLDAHGRPHPESRERVIKLSRDVQKGAKQAIFACHRGDGKKADGARPGEAAQPEREGGEHGGFDAHPTLLDDGIARAL